MRKRKPGNPKSTQDHGDAKASSLRSRASDGAWSAQDRVRTGTREGVERLTFPLQEKLLWPLQDRAAAMGRPARALSTATVVVLAAAAGVAGLLWAAPDQQEKTTSAPVAAVSTLAPEEEPAPEQPAQPTLRGATPIFKEKTEAASSEVDPAKAVVKSAPAESSSAGAAASSSSTTAKAANRKDPAVDGPPAGPAAVAVAADFSDAFVVYETGGLDPEVRRTFGTTATPELARALLRRPPRLPANVEVPQAKVLNVVPGPSHDGVYSVSVSLLRVGVTSELRLDMEQLKGKEWRVTNVLG